MEPFTSGDAGEQKLAQQVGIDRLHAGCVAVGGTEGTVSRQIAAASAHPFDYRRGVARAHSTLSACWRPSAHYSRANPGFAAIREIEQRYAVALPEDFRDYLLLAAPKEEYWDDGDILWWTPERIKNIPDEYEHPIHDPSIVANAATYLFFADYFLWCWAWAICCGDGPDRGKVALINGERDRIVAGSFTEFVEAAVRGPFSMS